MNIYSHKKNCQSGTNTTNIIWWGGHIQSYKIKCYSCNTQCTTKKCPCKKENVIYYAYCYPLISCCNHR